MTKKTLLSWSSGKDSAWTLHRLQQNPDLDVCGLFCSINEDVDRVAMHGTRVDLVKLQAQRLNLPLHLIHLPYPCSNETYERKMSRFIATALQDGIECFAFGDLFLEDIKQYREKQLSQSGIEPVFPIWGENTDRLALEMLSAGLKAVITCVDPKQISKNFAGRPFDQSFLDDLPASADPCGENGEFHSFVYDGPMFSEPLDVAVGDTVLRDNFIFADVYQP